MTFKDFREGNIDYSKGYSALLEKLDSLSDGGLQKAIAHCFRQYMGFVILKAMRDSKVAEKPLHYKAVKDFVKSFDTEQAHFYIVTQEWSTLGKDSNLCIYISSRAAAVRNSDTFYLRRKGDENRIDWEEMDASHADIIAPEEIEALYQKEKAINAQLKADVARLESEYRAARAAQPWITDCVYLSVK